MSSFRSRYGCRARTGTASRSDADATDNDHPVPSLQFPGLDSIGTMDLSPFRHRDFRLLYCAQFVSFVGTMITYVALPFQIYRLTGSSLAVGLLGAAELGPLLAT